MKLLSKIAFFALTLSSQQELTGKDMKSDDYSGLFFTAKAPLHLLLTTPAGKRCGFDALTNSSYNEIPGCGYDAHGLGDAVTNEPDPFPTRSLDMVHPQSGVYLLSVFNAENNGLVKLKIYNKTGKLQQRSLRLPNCGSHAASIRITYTSGSLNTKTRCNLVAVK